MGWWEFIAAYAAFFLSHAVPVRPRTKGRIAALVRRGGFTLAYSALSIAVLAWLISAAGRAPFVPLWDWAPWHPHLVLTLMLAVSLIVALTLGRPNPFSFGGPDAGFDPTHPGILRFMRHPLLVALALWAGAHMLANGDLAHVILFGGFAGFAILGQFLIDRRRRRQMGGIWDAARAALRDAPWLHAPCRWPELVFRVAAGISAFYALIMLHPHLFGVSPLP
ncbi:NnrU family protein [Primorskyibacter aestuariivivens]|uniref:NnrU family protein n=1 Tax=Primorskyibacter aestuariivivens TaxID=1888912 RepID=UPI002301A257|nr:NnrU family protein [Primorskyibacter aestuariivivens]MDA7429357.1 NnrU family protein [Primorskyibacter aestuariivivens]